MIKTTLAILLAVAALGFAGLWVASYFTANNSYWVSKKEDEWILFFRAHSGGGQCFISYLDDEPSQWYLFWGNSPFDTPGSYRFGVYSWDQRGWRYLGATFPLWAAFLVTAWFPILVLCRGPLRRRRRRKRGLCLHCGYNLTGAPEPRCPECGKATSPTKAPL